MNDADSKKLEETPYPIQDGPTIPWSVIAPHEAQAKKNHGQSLKRLAERGGLGAAEAYCVVKGLSLDAFREYGSERLRAWWWKYAESVNGSKAQLAEQDREIAELRARLPCTDAPWTLKERDDAKKLIIEQILEIERLRLIEIQLRNHVQTFQNLAEKAEADAELFGENLNQLGDFYKQYREKAAAELAEVRETNRAMLDIIHELQARVKELEELLGEETYAERAAVRHYKRVKELEQELLWAVDACEKTENLLAEKEQV